MEDTFGDLAEDIFDGISIGICYLGLFIRCLVVGTTPRGTSGRNTSGQQAESINTTGMYSLFRHPLYIGNFLIFIGVVLFAKVWWLVLLSSLAYWMYYERIIMAEEAYLKGKFGGAFTAWADVTPLYWPRFKNWQLAMPFSLKNVLKREYTGVLGIAAALTAVEILGKLIADRELKVRPEWYIYLGVSLAIYLILRFLKKHTKLLWVEGR